MNDWSSNGMNIGCDDKAFYGPKRKKRVFGLRANILQGYV